jgi:hypothetical protein
MRCENERTQSHALSHSLGVYNGIHTPPREVPFITDCLFIFMPGNTIGFSTRYGLGASSPLTTTPLVCSAIPEVTSFCAASSQSVSQSVYIR